MENIPVYLFLGFLEAGKTKFVQDTLCDKRFNDGEKTLLLLCEEGEEEYDPSLFSGENVTIELIENEAELSEKYLSELQEKNSFERVIVEYNGMWQTGSLFRNLPPGWNVVQCITFIDAQSIMSYNSNMRSLVVDKLQPCELAVFNRVRENDDKMQFHKLVRGVNRSADIAYEYVDGKVEYDEIEDPLPFDINAPVIKIEDRDYAIWYRDLLDEAEKYEGKTVKFKAIAAYDSRMPKNVFAAGRHVMTCCVEDIEYKPLICICNDEHGLKTEDWVVVTGKIKNEHSKFYRGNGPVLHIDTISVTTPPDPEIATFY